MRVFIGIKASPILQAEIAVWQEEHKKLNVRFIAQDSLHMTLVPPWEEENIDTAIAKLREAVKGTKSFNLLFDSVSERPNLIWASAKESAEAAELAAHLKKEFNGPDTRPFTPHITLARLDWPVHLQPEQVKWSEKAENICLFRSQPNSEYSVLERLNI